MPPSLDIPNPLCYIPGTDFHSIRSGQVPSIAGGKYLPNRMLFFFRRALEETIGLTAVSLVWHNAGADPECLSSSDSFGGLPSSSFFWDLPPVPDDLEKAVAFTSFSSLCASIAREYGEHGARTILYRCGRASLSGTLRSTSAIVGLDGPPLRASDGTDRIAEGLASVARLMEILSDMECRVDSTYKGCRFHVAACPECTGRSGAGGICHSVCGMLRGALDWLGTDPTVQVTEIQCTAGGAPGCVFSIAGA